mmetsp:Transcript_14413/g.31273  ORF Transcript_14413/g.31273 Transcript_14413/m.31273 type:complete len:106 (-) Transcript_14413:347-664(-)
MRIECLAMDRATREDNPLFPWVVQKTKALSPCPNTDLPSGGEVATQCWLRMAAALSQVADGRRCTVVHLWHHLLSQRPESATEELVLKLGSVQVMVRGVADGHLE